MYSYSFNSKRKEEIYNITGIIFTNNRCEANKIFHDIVNYEVEFYKSLGDNCHAKCDVKILDKKLEEITDKNFKFTKKEIRNIKLEQKLKMTDEEDKEEIEKLANLFK